MKNWKAKLLETLGSSNFLISLVGIVLLGLKANGIIPEGVEAESVFLAVAGVIDVLTLYVITPIVKIVKLQLTSEKKFDWKFLSSSNFITMVTTVLTLLLGVFVGEEFAAVVLGLVLNLLNVGSHVVKPTKVTDKAFIPQV